jgi:predicted amidohydrolase YtcJ
MIPVVGVGVKIFCFSCCAIFFLLSFCCFSPSGKEEADLILYNGTVWTVQPDSPLADAVAVSGEKILAVGSSQKILGFKGQKTRLIDCRNLFVLPGFIDSHAHFLSGGFSLSSVQLHSTESKDEFISRIKEKVRSLSAGEWLLYGDWDHQKFDPPLLPSKEWIDPFTPDNPVWINRHDGHMALANSLALEWAGVNRDTPSPPGGEILKDPRTGEPTGILKDSAMDLVDSIVPDPTLEKKAEAARAALAHAAQRGVTSIHDMNFEDSHEALQKIHRSEGLTARFYGYVPIARPEVYSEIQSKLHPGNGTMRIGGLKGFVDGSLGSTTALFFEPYTDFPETSGLLVQDMLPEGMMEKRIRLADSKGLQVAVHAIGDRANHLLLDIYEKIIGDSGNRDRRWRVEHAQHLLSEDIERFGKLGIIASVQPYHAIDDGRWAENKIGKERARFSYAYQSLLDKGAVLVCGSDWTVAPLDPLSGIYAAVSRRTLDGENPGGWYPEQRISLEEAIKGYTLNAAYAEFAESMKGTIEKGKLADLVVLSNDLFEIPVEDILDTRVLMTIVGGRIVHDELNTRLHKREPKKEAI